MRIVILFALLLILVIGGGLLCYFGIELINTAATSMARTQYIGILLGGVVCVIVGEKFIAPAIDHEMERRKGDKK